MDDLCDSHNYVASGVSQRIYDRRIHPYSASYCNCRSSDQDYPREKPCVTEMKKQDNYRGIEREDGSRGSRLKCSRKEGKHECGHIERKVEGN